MTQGGEFYVLNKSIYTPGEDEDNPILNTEFTANFDFRFWCVILRGSKSVFWMYSEDYSVNNTDFGSEEYVSASKMNKRG